MSNVTNHYASTHNALKVREKPMANSQGTPMQAPSALLRSMERGIMANPKRNDDTVSIAKNKTMSKVPTEITCRNKGWELRTIRFLEL